MSNSHLLAADSFKNDPRIQEAKKLIEEVIYDHQKNFTSISPPKEELIQSYQETLEAFSEIRGGKLFFPYLGSGWGKGPLVELLDGSVKYDMISGIGVHFWGHSHPSLIAESIDASLSDTIMQGHLQQNIDSLLLSRLLTEISGLNHCFLSSTGVMANENAIKLAFQNKYPANRILAFEHCFLGRTLALSQITDKPSFREGLPLNIPVDYIPFYNDKDPENSLKTTLNVLQNHLDRFPKQHALMCFELVQGEGGFNIGTSSFFKAIMQVLRKNNITVFVDEVQTFGRTLELFAFQYFQLDDLVDIVSIGKLSQVCATLFRSSFKPKPGLLSQTFTSSSSALKASYWGIKQLVGGRFFGPKGKLAHLHELFLSHFKRMEAKWPDIISGPYGIGAMIAFTPFNGNPAKVTSFVQELFRVGVISFTAGKHPMRVRFLIPGGVMEDNDVFEVMQIVEKTLEKCSKES